MAQMHLFLDDICPHGGMCDRNSRHCMRIHFINNRNWCIYARNDRPFECDPQCPKDHIPQHRLTHRLLSVFLYKYFRTNFRSLHDYYINDTDIYAIYQELYPAASTAHLSRNTVARYNKYYLDNQCQSNVHFDDINKTYIAIWYVQSYAREQDNIDHWRIRMTCDVQFIIQRICRAYTADENQCLFSFCPSAKFPWNFCPYFHLHRTVLNMMQLLHSDLAIAFPIIGSALARFDEDIVDEKNQTDLGPEHVNYIRLTHAQHIMHKEWCDTLRNIHDQHSADPHNAIMNASTCQPDEVMDGGFHAFHEHYGSHAWTVLWDVPIHKDKCIELIDKIKQMFNSMNETPMDIQIGGIQKYIILDYSVSCDIFSKFVTDFRMIFLNIPKKWCFNRRISIAVSTQQRENKVYLTIEFENVNTFCSVDMIRNWFEQLSNEYSKRKVKSLRGVSIMNCMQREGDGSYHFVCRLNHEAVATVYLNQCHLDPKAWNNAMFTINGAALILQQSDHFGAILRPYARKFLKYYSTLYAYLCKENKTDWHYKQYETIQMLFKDVQPMQSTLIPTSYTNGNQIQQPQSIQKSQSYSNGNNAMEHMHQAQPIQRSTSCSNGNRRRSSPPPPQIQRSRRSSPPPPLPVVFDNANGNHRSSPPPPLSVVHANGNDYKDEHKEMETHSPVTTLMPTMRSFNQVMNGDTQSVDYSSEDSSAGLASVYREGIHLDKGLIAMARHEACGNLNGKDISNHRRSPPRQHTDIISRRRGPPPPNHMNNEYKNGYEETKTPSPVPYEIIMSPLRLPSPNPIGKSTSVQVHQMNGDKQSYDYSSEDSSAEGLASVYREGIHLDKGLIAMARHEACGNLNGKD
eukprot:377546_1